MSYILSCDSHRVMNMLIDGHKDPNMDAHGWVILGLRKYFNKSTNTTIIVILKEFVLKV